MATITKATPGAPVELPDRSHLDGCPASRIERYSGDRPEGQRVDVVRCIDCGAQAEVPR